MTITAMRPRRSASRVRVTPWTDIAAVAALTAIMVAEYRGGPIEDGLRYGPMGLSPLFSFLTIAPVAFRRRAPVAALLVSVSFIVLPDLVTATWVMFFSGSIVVAFLQYTVARHRPARIALPCGVLPLLAYGVQLVDASVRLHRPQSDGAGNLIFMGVVVAIATGLGVGLQRGETRRTRLAAVLADLEVALVERERLAVVNERRGIARDLHDVVAHAVSLMLLHAGAARLALDLPSDRATDPAIDNEPMLVDRFLEAIEETGLRASQDLATMLGVLRTRDSGLDVVSHTGLATIDELIATVRRAGLDLKLIEHGTPPALPRAFDHAAYRIVQEAVTNTLKHAGPTAGRLEISYGDPLVIDLTDEGRCEGHPLPESSGHGLVGMRERAALFGGWVQAGSVGGGYRVLVVLPLPQQP